MGEGKEVNRITQESLKEGEMMKKRKEEKTGEREGDEGITAEKKNINTKGKKQNTQHKEEQ